MYKTKEDIAIAREVISCPGDTLAEHIEYTGMTQAELAERMGRPKKTINEIIQGKAQITPETALQLERVLASLRIFGWSEKNAIACDLLKLMTLKLCFRQKSGQGGFPAMQ